MTDEPEILVTQAQRADAPALAKMLEEWLAVSAIPWPAPEPAAMVEWVLHTIDTGYAVQAKGAGRLVGVAGVQPCYLPWNISDAIYRDAFFYVPRSRSTSTHHEAQERRRNAEKRASDVSNGMLEALKLYCASRGKPLLMEILTGVGTDRVERWLGIKGGRYAGGVMLFGMEG